MVVERGEIWWANLGKPRGSSPGYKHPVIIIQSDYFNQTKINTLIAALITSNLSRAEMPGNIYLSERASGLGKESVINISQLITVDKADLLEFVGILSNKKMSQVDDGLRLVLSL